MIALAATKTRDIIDLSPNTCYPNLVEKDLDELPKPLFSKFIERSEKRDVSPENVLPQGGEWPIHGGQTPETSPAK
jgi:hypothetical protein